MKDRWKEGREGKNWDTWMVAGRKGIRFTADNDIYRIREAAVIMRKGKAVEKDMMGR